jgi:ribosomal-protein-alanine N-acetyltransferase
VGIPFRITSFFSETDIDQVCEIEQQCFKAPWKKQTYLGIISRSYPMLYVAKKKDADSNPSIIAHICYNRHDDKIHIFRIAVRPEWQRFGIATRLMETIVYKAAGQGVRCIFLEVRQFNEAAISFYSRNGFQLVAIRAGYYTDSNEDALIFFRQLKQAA